jgi:hypothetical protein
MQPSEQIEKEFRQLSLHEQELLLIRLVNLMKPSGRTDLRSREDDLNRFFAEWDGTHSVTVGEKPTRARTYADNSRLR